MAASITADLRDLCTDTVTAFSVSVDGFGKATVTGSNVFTSCRVSGSNKLVRDASGAEVVSTVQALILDEGAADVALGTTGYQYAIPDRYARNTGLEAISVSRVTDENGGHHVKLTFP